MKGHSFIFAIGLLTILYSTLAKANTPSRIEAIYFDHGKVGKIYLYPGRTSLLDFPCEITKAVSGPAGDVEVIIGSTDKSELDIWLKAGSSQPTNLTVRCHKQVFVFDIIPSRTTHQEYLEIIGSYGGASLTETKELYKPKSSDEIYSYKKLIISSDQMRDKRLAKKSNRVDPNRGVSNTESKEVK